jgi:hypothetical protein
MEPKRSTGVSPITTNLDRSRIADPQKNINSSASKADDIGVGRTLGNIFCSKKTTADKS